MAENQKEALLSQAWTLRELQIAESTVLTFWTVFQQEIEKAEKPVKLLTESQTVNSLGNAQIPKIKLFLCKQPQRLKSQNFCQKPRRRKHTYCDQRKSRCSEANMC